MHRLQGDVSVHPVHDRMELRFQVYRVIAPLYFEIGRVGTASDLYAFEYAIESASRRPHPLASLESEITDRSPPESH